MAGKRNGLCRGFFLSFSLSFLCYDLLMMAGGKINSFHEKKKVLEDLL